MNVKGLIKILNELDGDLKIIIQKDGEGNNYSPLSDHYIGIYIPVNSYSGEIYTKEDFDKEELEEWEDINKIGSKVLILTPLNWDGDFPIKWHICDFKQVEKFMKFWSVYLRQNKRKN